MPIKQSAFKALRQNKKRHLRNIAVKTELKTVIKKFREAIQSGDKEKAKTLLRLATSKLDKAASHGIIHKNTASRKKSRILKKLNPKA